METISINQQFAEDIAKGLNKNPKQLSSKYFYDKKGDKLFQQIMKMPEYYLSRSELEIFEQQKDDILQAIGSQSFDLIELGAGDGSKTKVLLKHFLEKGMDYRYVPIDISENILEELTDLLAEELPNLTVLPMPGDYFKMLKTLPSEKGRKKVLLFLGSNIGNFSTDQAIHFISALNAELSTGDMMIIGLDLKKDPQIILDAYNDPAGITAAFNLNLLHRINAELGGNFVVEQFQHWETYDPVSGEAKSYLISKQKQTVYIEALEQSFDFDAWEAIHTEISRKYGLKNIDYLAQQTGFRVAQHFFDSNDYFVDSLLVKA